MLTVTLSFQRDDAKAIPIFESTRPDFVTDVAELIVEKIRQSAHQATDPFVATLFFLEANRIESLVEASGALPNESPMIALSDRSVLRAGVEVDHAPAS